MSSRPSTPSTGVPIWTVALLVAVGAFVAWESTVRSRHLLGASATYGVTVDAPAASATSPTGYADGRRSQLLPTGSADTAHWIMQTQHLLANGEWRIRRVDYDNVPDGREVHWAGPLHWWLAGLAWIDHAVSGRPLGQSVEHAALYSGPVMLALLLIGVTPLLARRFAPLAAAVFLIGLVATFPFYLDFTAGYADHHGLVNICAMLTVLFLAVGSAGSGASARRWFSASAIAGGGGLWISAATIVPVFVGVGLGVLAGAWWARGASDAPAWWNEPDLWRRWARIGGVVSLAAWLIEYFPSHLSMRLEVNHPLYALAWVGAGEVLRAAVIASRQGWAALGSRDRLWGGIGVGLALLLPGMILLTSAKTFWVADSFLWRLHAQHISEFQGLTRILARGFSANTVSLWLPMAGLAALAWPLFDRATSSRTKSLLAATLMPALLGALMGWTQIRWLGLAFALSVPAFAVFLREHAGRRRSWGVGALVAVVFLPGLITNLRRPLALPETTTDDIQNLAVRDVAHWLKLRARDQRAVVLASPTTTTKLLLYGGVQGIDTLYWENLPGLRNAADLFAARSDEEARALAARLGVTHIVFFTWEVFEPALVLLQRDLPPDAPVPTDAFYARLLKSPVPPLWLQPVPFKLPKHPALEGEKIWIWQVVPEQAPATALARATNYFLELGQLEASAKFAEPLMQFPDELTAMVMLAAIASRDGDQEGFTAAFGQVLARLDQASSLALDEQIHLAVVLAVGRRADLAQAQVRASVARLDEAALRQLSVGTLSDLLALSEALEVPLPDAHLRDVAERLMPPKRN